jgi:hypothetical protein
MVGVCKKQTYDKLHGTIAVDLPVDMEWTASPNCNRQHPFLVGFELPYRRGERDGLDDLIDRRESGHSRPIPGCQSEPIPRPSPSHQWCYL